MEQLRSNFQFPIDDELLPLSVPQIHFTKCYVIVRDDRESRREFRRECKRYAIDADIDGIPCTDTKFVGGRIFGATGATHEIETAFYAFGAFKPFILGIEYRRLSIPRNGSGQGEARPRVMPKTREKRQTSPVWGASDNATLTTRGAEQAAIVVAPRVSPLMPKTSRRDCDAPESVRAGIQRMSALKILEMFLADEPLTPTMHTVAQAVIALQAAEFEYFSAMAELASVANF